MEKKAPHIVIIETERLLLREWAEADIAPFAEINRNERVMEYFPKLLSYDETVAFYNRITQEFAEYGFGLYAVELKSTGEFIGYVGFWKSHAALTLLATQDLPTFGYNMIAPLKSWCWGSILFYPFKISRFS